jgi:hypothetical protein
MHKWFLLFMFLLMNVCQAADCFTYTYKSSWDTSLVVWDTCRMVIHVIGKTDSTSWSQDSASIQEQVDVMNWTWATAKIFWQYTINWVPNDMSDAHMPNSPLGNPTPTRIYKNQYVLAPDSQMQVYYVGTAGGYGDATNGELWAKDIIDILSHESGHVMLLLHTFTGTGLLNGNSGANDSLTCQFGDHAEVSQLAIDDPRNTDSAKDVNGDKQRDTPADPGFGIDSLPNCAIDPCTDSGWGTLDPNNMMSYIAVPALYRTMTRGQAMTVRCVLETKHPGWFLNGIN